jgi:hypothetical protein
LVVSVAGAISDAEAEAVELAREALGLELGVEPEVLALGATSAQSWPDSSLGCPEKGMLYNPVVTPGFRVVFDHGGRHHAVHVAGGRAVVCQRPGSRAAPARSPSPEAIARALAVSRAREHLVRELGVLPGEISVRSVRPAVWPDDRLGCPTPERDEATPEARGFAVALEANGVRYSYRVSEEKVAVCDDPAEQS